MPMCQRALDRLSEGDPVNNGFFTRVFMKEMERPGVPTDQVAREVRAEVNRMAQTVKHERVPAIYDQVIGQYYFCAQNEARGGNVDEVEIVFWISVKDSSDPAELRAYLDKYPDGQFAGLAQAPIKRLEQGQGVTETKAVAENLKAESKDAAAATLDEIEASVVEVMQPLPEFTVDSSAALTEITPAINTKPGTPAPVEAVQAEAVPAPGEQPAAGSTAPENNNQAQTTPPP